jgi:hypothetical protein
MPSYAAAAAACLHIKAESLIGLIFALSIKHQNILNQMVGSNNNATLPISLLVSLQGVD